MVSSDGLAFVIVLGYVASAVVLGVLSNRLRWMVVLALSVLTLAAGFLVICRNCFAATSPPLGDSIVGALLYFGVPLLLGFIVPFLASRYIGRIVLQFVARNRSREDTGS